MMGHLLYLVLALHLQVIIMDEIQNEIRELLTNFWILKEESPDLYYEIKRKQNIIKDFVTKTLGSKLIIHDRFIKLEKIPSNDTGNIGIDTFTSKSDYVYLCIILLYLEDKTRGEVFVLSSLIDYVKNTAVTMNLETIPDWTLRSDRHSLVRVMDFLTEISVIKVKDQEKTSFKDSEEAEALYEVTGLANYVMRLFTNDIFEIDSVNDFLNDEWKYQDLEKGDVRRYKVYRNLLFTPATFSYNITPAELDYIKKMRGYLENEFTNLGYELEITKNMAFLYEYETSNSKYNFPNNKKITDIVLMVNNELYKMITNKEIPLDDNEVGHINRESLEVILKDIKTNNKDYLSKQYQDLSLGKFFDEVINYMIEYSFLKEEDNTYLVLPTIARFNGELVRSNTKQMDLFGGEDDV